MTACRRTSARRYRRRAGRLVLRGRGLRLRAGLRPAALERLTAFARFTVLARPVTALLRAAAPTFLRGFFDPEYLRTSRPACLMK